MRRRFAAGLLVLALAFACKDASTPEPEQPTAAASAIPEHIRPIVEAWDQVWRENIKAIFDEQHTSAEWARLDAARTAAQQRIAAASPEDRPWLLAAYASAFGFFGIGSELADALLEIPPAHPVWSVKSFGLFKALDETSDPARFRAYIDEVAALHPTPSNRAGVLALELEDADGSHDWPRAEALWAELQSFELAATVGAFDAAPYSPDRELRVDKQVPRFCAPAIAGPHAGFSVCIDELFPHDTKTLIVGWATWCGPCNRQLPEVVEVVRGRAIRVIAINYMDDRERALEHLRELGVDDWTILELTTEEAKRTAAPGNIPDSPIPMLVLVDEQGIIRAGPPWLDAAALAAAL